VSEDGNDGLDEQELASADEDETKEGGAAHGSFGVVEETEDAGVVEFGGVVLDEKVACVRTHQHDPVGVDGGTDRRTSRRDLAPRKLIQQSRREVQ
jgi:hypothetical protein